VRKSRHKDMSRQKFHMFTLIKRVENTKHGEVKYLCECDCGTIKEVVLSHLRRNSVKSCGCKRRSSLEGKKFGRLLVKKYSHTDKHRCMRWECLCKCGNICYPTSAHLTTGTVKSCGCLVAKSNQIKLDNIKQDRVLNNNLAKLHPNLCLIWDYKKNNKTPEEFTSGSGEKVWWTCDKHESYLQTIYAKSKRNHTCPKCKVSHGERRIISILDKLKIEYLFDQKENKYKEIEDCKIDFYLPRFDLYVEYHGRQHYKAIDIGVWGIKSKEEGEARLKKQQIRDQLVRDTLGNKLLEIPYWDFDNIETLILEKLEWLKEN